MPRYARQHNQRNPTSLPLGGGGESSTDAPLDIAEHAEYVDEVWYAGTRSVSECNRLLLEPSKIWWLGGTVGIVRARNCYPFGSTGSPQRMYGLVATVAPTHAYKQLPRGPWHNHRATPVSNAFIDLH